MKKLFLMWLAWCLPAFVLFAQNNTDDITGVWLTENGKAHVKIEKIGAKYFGRIIWLKEPNNEEGKPKMDKNNTDPKLRTAPLLGIRLLKDFQYKGKGLWENGTIYDPENGKTYSCKITMKDKDVLNIRGFIGVSLIGRTSVWKRVNK